MALKSCQFNFSREDSVYHSGEVVEGRLNIVLDEPQQISELQLKIRGNAKCSWKDTHNSAGKVTYFHGKEIYLSVTNDLLAGKYKEEDGYIELLAGDHAFTFSAYIPAGAPTSYEGPYGRIKYYVKVTMRRSKKLDSSKASFTVLRKHDLNLFPHLMNPLGVRDYRKYHFLFTKAGRITISTELPMAGYVPGQNIFFKCYINNESRASVTEVKFYLKQIIEFTVKNPSKNKRCIKKILSETQDYGLDEGQNCHYDVNMCTPAVHPTSDSTILTIGYYIKVKAFVSGSHKNFKVIIPIEIGTIPLLRRRVRSVALPGEPSSISAEPNCGDCALPTYEESEIEKINREQDANGDVELLGYMTRFPFFSDSALKMDSHDT